uniref:ADF-H domain-containing protein n=1 Tax=Haptolina ericina TaxID=156174 RepID=A0A7S3AUC2_9EUKA
MEDGVFYGLVRTTEQIDNSTTVKFVFISFIGERLGVMRKAKLSTYKGTVTEAFTPFHLEMMGMDSAADVTSAAIVEMLRAKSGKTGAASDANPANLLTPKEQQIRVACPQYGGTFSSAPKEHKAAWERAAPLASEAVLAAIKAVRSDTEATSWVFFGYGASEPPALQVVGQGNGPAEEAAPLLDAAHMMYGLVRLSQVVDQSTIVKFAFVSWLGDNVPPMRKAKLSTIRGAASELLSPFNTELLNVTVPTDVSNARLMAQLEA